MAFKCEVFKMCMCELIAIYKFISLFAGEEHIIYLASMLESELLTFVFAVVYSSIALITNFGFITLQRRLGLKPKSELLKLPHD